uniref:Uncharacterized protein n=1 Tax=Ditylenchus dipsaci TaxID=166011 RepID=A0A915CTL5_9BILA
MKQLSSLDTNICVTDFVEISHLLLDISTSESGCLSSNGIKKTDSSMADWSVGCVGAGDELCTWWTHLITCGLYWRHGDTSHAQQHYSLVRKCPSELLNNDLALAIGLAFCTRKMCYDDKAKKNFTDMAWLHCQKSFSYLEKDGFPLMRKSSKIFAVMQKLARGITYEWIMMTLLDVWNNKLSDEPCWEQSAPNPMRRLYHTIFSQFIGLRDYCDSKKVLTFKLLGRALTGGNPITTWYMLKALLSNQSDAVKSSKSSAKKSKGNQPLLEFHCQFQVIQRLRKDFFNRCNLN